MARVLSISGDGARTAVAAHVLAELERRTGQPVHKLFHMIVGEGAGAVSGHAPDGPAQRGRAGLCRWGAEAAAIAIEEGLPAFRSAQTGRWCDTDGGTRVWAARRKDQARCGTILSLTGEDGLLGGADLSSALTDLAVPVFDTANVRPFLFRSWKAAGDVPARWRGIGPV